MLILFEIEWKMWQKYTLFVNFVIMLQPFIISFDNFKTAYLLDICIFERLWSLALLFTNMINMTLVYSLYYISFQPIYHRDICPFGGLGQQWSAACLPLNIYQKAVLKLSGKFSQQEVKNESAVYSFLHISHVNRSHDNISSTNQSTWDTSFFVVYLTIIMAINRYLQWSSVWYSIIIVAWWKMLLKS